MVSVMSNRNRFLPLKVNVSAGAGSPVDVQKSVPDRRAPGGSKEE